LKNDSGNKYGGVSTAIHAEDVAGHSYNQMGAIFGMNGQEALQILACDRALSRHIISLIHSQKARPFFPPTCFLFAINAIGRCVTTLHT
jgi:hypothetical protein